MYSRNILFLVLVYGVTNVLCKAQLKIPCALEDSRCTTVAARPLYKTIVDGIPELGVPPSDPLYKDVIKGFVPDMNYTLTDAYLYGMKDCNIENHKLNIDSSTWDCSLYCPRLIMKSIYDVHGLIGGNHIEGKGPCEITHDKYYIGMHGTFENYKGVDGKQHMAVTYFEFDRLEVLGNTKYDLSNLYHGDRTRSIKMHKYLNENWKSVTSYAHHPVMYAFLSKLLENLNIFLDKVPAHEIFYRDA